MMRGVLGGLTSSGRWLGSEFGGGDPNLPYRKDLVEAAPKVVDAEEAAGSLSEVDSSPEWAAWRAARADVGETLAMAG